MMVVAAKVARVMVVNVVENTVKLCSFVFKRLTVFAVIAKRRYRFHTNDKTIGAMP